MPSRTFLGIATLFASACTADVAPHTGSETLAIMPLQGRELQGLQLQGTQLAGMKMVGFQFAGATLNGSPLVNVRVEHGELVAEQNSVTLHDTGLAGAHLFAQVRNISVNPPTSATVEYRIASVQLEDAMHYDPTGTGSTWLYELEQNVDNTGTYAAACLADTDSRHVAIPVTATWNEHGDRVASSTLFTFGCTTGVIAKCYRWGYRPWVTSYGDLVTMHQICTRMARADYCGDGTSHTHDGTMINAWDSLPPPGPIMPHQPTPAGMVFEAGWSTNGAVCLSHARWLLGGLIIAALCPTRLIPPNILLGATVCDLEGQVLGGATSRLYNDSNLNLNLDDL